MKTTTITRHSWSPAWLEALAVMLLLTLVGALAWPGMHAPLLLDDVDQLAHVKGFSSWHDCFGQDAFGMYRPMKNLIFYGVGTMPLFSWHLLNLSVHLGVILVVYLFLRHLLGSPTWALVALTLWATSPTQACAAVWMTCINISISIAFTCACLFCHDLSQTHPRFAWRLTLLAGLFLFLAQNSYEAAVAAPALCVLTDALRQRALFSRASLMRYAMLATLTLVYLAIRSQAGASHCVIDRNYAFAPTTTAWQISLSAPWFLWRHFSMWLMPAGRIEFLGTYLWGISASPYELAAAWGWLLLYLGVLVCTWKRQAWLAFGLLWFLIASFPSSNFIPIWAGPIEDYYLIVPGIGLAIAMTGAAKALVERIHGERGRAPSAGKLICGALLGVGILWRACGIPLFCLQAGLWCRPLELYLQCAQTRPGQYQAQALAARELLANGQLSAAKQWAQKAYDSGPWYATSSMILGSVALHASDHASAENHLSEVLRITPPHTPVAEFSRLQLARTFMAQAAKRHLVKETLLSLLQNPQASSHTDAIHLQIACYLAQDQPSDAHRAATKAAQLHPDDPQWLQVIQEIETKFPTSAMPTHPQK